MKADDAQRLVIRTLVEPDKAPRTATSAINPLAAKLALFGGFIARIKHAQLRRVFPLTLRLLAIHGADIAFFASIAADFQARRSRSCIPQPELVDRFANGLRQWLPLAPANARQPIAALLRHEQLIWLAAHKVGEHRNHDCPALALGVAVSSFDCDVLAMAEALRTDPFTAPTCEPRELYLLYSPGQHTVGINAIDAFSAWVLSRLDGCTSVSEICRQWPDEIDGFERVIRGLIEDGYERGLTSPATARMTA